MIGDDYRVLLTRPAPPNQSLLGHTPADPAVDPLAPAAWGRFAPLASDAAAAGDAVAARVLEAAAEALLGTLDAVRERGADDGGAVVMTGSVLERSASVRSGVRAGLEARGLRAVQGLEPVDGALRLAAELAARSGGAAR